MRVENTIMRVSSGASKLASTFDGRLVHHCAPTLAGIKPSNLFTCPLCVTCANDVASTQRRACPTLDGWISRVRPLLAAKGVAIEVLARRQRRHLLYVYREDLLESCLKAGQTAAYLTTLGYDVSNMSSCVETLRQRVVLFDDARTVACEGEFPHEIGLFLGYPFADVMGFIRGDKACCEIAGHWRVYSDPEQARKTFDAYNSCTKALSEAFNQGVQLKELVTPSAHCADLRQRRTA